MKKLLALLLACSLAISGCASGSKASQSSSAETESAKQDESMHSFPETSESSVDTKATSAETDTAISTGAEPSSPVTESTDNDVPEFANLGDAQLLRYMEDSVYAKLTGEFASEDYLIENVSAIYYSKEYLEELAYNSNANIFFGYTLAELDEQFQGTRYVFTLGENGETVVEPLKDYDDTYDRVIKNIAIGTGVILVCVTVSVVTGGAGAAPVSMIFAASAKTGTMMALSSGTISAVAAGTVKGIQTGDMSEAVKAAALAGSESFKWGAITGAIVGGLREASALRNASKAAEAAKNATKAADNIPSWRESELAALEKYGGREQVSFLDGVEVPKSTPGATRPDILRTIGKHLEAIEVKNYDLATNANRNELYNELVREVSARVTNLPPGTTQRIILDVTGRGFSPELITEVMEQITLKLIDIYPNIPIEIMGAVL